jgi:hypothetical protein
VTFPDVIIHGKSLGGLDDDHLLYGEKAEPIFE